jgi:hydrogenase nickel incorporation protein HypB
LRDGDRSEQCQAGVLAISLVSSPGSGKTAILEKTLTLLRSRYRVAALAGDLATDNDAERLARSQAPVMQIITGTVCHLEAAMIQKALDGEGMANYLEFPESRRISSSVATAVSQ